MPDNDLNLLGKAILAFIIRPEGPKDTPPVKMIHDTTVEYGSYVANSLSGCNSCHTQRSLNTGAHIGENMAGGPVGPMDNDPTKMLVAPNLTPDAETGKLSTWTYESFKSRFEQGRLIPGSIMPWEEFRNLDDIELRALWKYLHSLKPVKKKTGPPIQPIENFK